MSSVTRPPSWAMTPSRVRKGRSNAALTKWTPGSPSSGPRRPSRCAGSGSSVSASMKTTMSPWATDSARHIASPLPRAGPKAGRRSSSAWTSAPGARGTLGGAVARRAVDDDDLVDEPGLGERHDGGREDAADRLRAVAGREDDGDRRPALALAQRQPGIEGAPVVAAAREPLAELEVAGEAARGAAVGPGGGRDAHGRRTGDRDAGAFEARLERLVLERGQRLEPADRAVGARGHGHRRAGEEVVLGGRVAGEDGVEAHPGARVAARDRRRGEAVRLVAREHDGAADRLRPARGERELLGEPVLRRVGVGVGAHDEAVRVAGVGQAGAGEVHPVPAGRPDAAPRGCRRCGRPGDPGGGALRRGARPVGAAVEHDDDLVRARARRRAARRARGGRADALRLVARRDDDDGPEDVTAAAPRARCGRGRRRSPRRGRG